ncbi:MAG: hypothetical protein JWQ98_1749 [Chlorobi bacterium]|nr:hypothetical protein [Chlorobiota bacterium]
MAWESVLDGAAADPRGRLLKDVICGVGLKNFLKPHRGAISGAWGSAPRNGALVRRSRSFPAL